MRLQFYSRNWGTFQAPQGSRVKQQIQSSVGQNPFLSQTQLMSHTQSQNPFLSQTQLMSHTQSQNPFLSQTQLMSHTQSHYFNIRHVTNRHDQTSFGWFLSRMGKSYDSRGGYTIHYIHHSVFQSYAPSYGVSYVCQHHFCYSLGQVCYIVAHDYLKEIPMVLLICFSCSLLGQGICVYTKM